MTNTQLEKRWREFQLDRVKEIREWYQNHYKGLFIGDPLIEYIVLWSIFNALYNTYDLPNNKLRQKIYNRFRFWDKFGFKMPSIRVSGDFKRLKHITEELLTHKTFLDLISQGTLRRHIRSFVDRIPSVNQNEEVDPNKPIPIIMQDDKNRWVIEDEFIPSSIRGIASFDRRIFLADGYTFFEYAGLDNPWDKDGQFINIGKTVKQLFGVLYQLRNNIVHGGSTVYSKKEIIHDARPILEAIVLYQFENAEDIFNGEKS